MKYGFIGMTVDIKNNISCYVVDRLSNACNVEVRDLLGEVHHDRSETLSLFRTQNETIITSNGETKSSSNAHAKNTSVNDGWGGGGGREDEPVRAGVVDEEKEQITTTTQRGGGG